MIRTNTNYKLIVILMFTFFFVTACTQNNLDRRKSQSPAKIESNKEQNDPSTVKPISTKQHYENVSRETTANLPAFLQHLRDSGLEDEDGYFLIEGDILLTEAEVGVWFRSNQVITRSDDTIEKDTPAHELLVGLTASGKRSYWQTIEERHLTYAIDKKSFTDEEYAVVVKAVEAAGDDWNKLCDDCHINFEHLTDFDDNPSHANVKFIVRRVRNNRYIATAFFPNYPQFRRYVNIGTRFFADTLRFNQTGILRHELGHTLGYRHEHIQGIRGCKTERNNWTPLTKYDEHSVMHYFCGGGGSLNLELTSVDKEGHSKLYKIKK